MNMSGGTKPMNVNNPIRDDALASRVQATARGFMPARILLTALELDLFGRLANDCLTASELASRMSTNARATEILLNALAAMNLLSKTGDSFSNVEALSRLLAQGNPHSQAGALLHIAHQWERWSHLTEIVTSGRCYTREWTPEMSGNLASAMGAQAASTMDRMVRAVDCFGVRSMLDLGGGAGTYSIAFAHRYPRLQVVLLDKDDHLLGIAAKEIAKHDLSNRIAVKNGDFFVDDIGNAYDLVTLCSVICLYGEEQNRALLNKVHASLAQGGRVLIWDLVLDESKTSPLQAAIFAVNMLTATASGRCYSHREVTEWLQYTGFDDIRRIPIESFQLITGRK